MNQRNAGELLVEILREAGVDTAFGIVSIHNQPLVEAVAHALRFVPVRHEATAVNAADGYARVTQGIGCALTSTGTGSGNAAGSMVEALSAGSPVLHVTGQIPTTYLGQGRGFIHETRDQTQMLAAVSKASYLINNAVEGSATVRGAINHAMTAPRGPVSIEWPFDLQYLTQQDDLVIHPVRPPAPADDEALAAAAETVLAAERPVLWVGGGAVFAPGAVADLAERLGAGVFSSNAGRGCLPEDHELSIGNFGASAAGQALLDEADLVISIGTHFRSNETNTYRLRLPARHIQVDVDPAALSRVYPASVGIVGDAAEVLTRLRDRLGEELPRRQRWRQRVAQARRAAREGLRAAVGPQAEICDAIRQVFPRNAVLARDVTIPASSWGNRLLEIYDPTTNLFARGGGIGQGLGMALGGSIARAGVPALALVGDGGLAVHLGELLTLVQERAPVVVLTFNDGGYGVLRNMQEKYFDKRSGVDLHGPRFDELARAVGMEYRSIATPSVATEVLAEAAWLGAPCLVEVPVAELGEMPVPFTPPVDVPVGELSRPGGLSSERPEG